MTITPDPEDLPHGDHLNDDINLPEEPGAESAAEFSADTFTSTQLNAGQQVPGLSTDGQYREGFDPEDQDFEGGGPEES